MAATVSTHDVPGDVPGGIRYGRVAVAVVVIVGLSSAPFASLSRWVADLPPSDVTWPYRYTYWVAAIAGALWFLVDVAIPLGRRALDAGRFPLSRSEAATLWLPIVLAGWAVLSLAWSDSPERTLRHAPLAALVVLAALWFGAGLRFAEQVAALFVGLHTIVFVSVPLAIGYGSARFPNSDAWMGVFNNPNSLSPAAGLGIVAAAGVWLLTVDRARAPVDAAVWRPVAVVCVVVDLIVMWQAGSATGWLALVAAVAALGFLVVASRVIGRGVEGGADLGTVRVAVAAVVAALAVTTPWWLRGVASAMGRDATLTGRTVIWDFITDSMGDRWVAGFGFQSFWDDPINRQLLGQRRVFSTVPDAAHSTFMESLLYLGLVGLVVVAAVVALGVGRVWWTALAGRDVSMIWWATVAVFVLVENATESMIAYHSIFWLLLVATGAASLRPSARL